MDFSLSPLLVCLFCFVSLFGFPCILPQSLFLSPPSLMRSLFPSVNTVMAVSGCTGRNGERERERRGTWGGGWKPRRGGGEGEGGRVVMVMRSSLCWVAKATSGIHLIQQPLKPPLPPPPQPPPLHPRHMTVGRALHTLHT